MGNYNYIAGIQSVAEIAFSLAVDVLFAILVGEAMETSSIGSILVLDSDAKFVDSILLK